MRKTSKYIISCCLACLCALGLEAQSRRDTTGFDAMQYSMQKRHSKSSERFVSAPWYDNTFISLYGGISQIFDTDESTFSPGPSAGLKLGKWFDDASGLSLGVTWRDYRRNTDALEAMSYVAEASYLYNLTSYRYGYATADFCDVLLVSGLGYQYNDVRGAGDMGFNLHLGLNVVMRVFNHVDLYLEPLGRFEYMASASTKLRFSYAMNMGLTYNYISKRETMPKADFRKDRFISLTGGANVPVSEFSLETMGLWKSIGPHASISYGRWYSDLFAVRVSVFYEHDTWNRHLDDYTCLTRYFGGRLEGMFEFLHFCPGYESWRVPMTFSLLLGPEVGGMYKEDLHEVIFEPYIGATAALQYKCRIGGPVSFLIEPRISIVPFSHDSITDETAVYANYMDVVCNLNFGLDFAF